MIGTRPIGVAPIGVLGSEQANEYVGTGGAQAGGSADVVFTQVVPSLTINGSIRVQTVEQSIRVRVATPDIRATNWESTAAINRIQVVTDNDPTDQFVAGSNFQLYGTKNMTVLS